MLGLSILMAAMATSLLACQVPVFRYALERWLSDKYEILVVHRGAMSDQDRQQFAKLQEGVTEFTNAVVRAIDIDKQPENGLRELWDQRRRNASSVVAILYPQGAHEVPDRLMDACPLEEHASQDFFDSPLRRELAKRLGNGQSAVWILVPASQSDKNETAQRMLDEQLRRCQSELKLPPIDDLASEPAEVQEKANQMRVEFSSVVLSRQDPRERLLLQMLLSSEDDLAIIDEPLAFPVFGRGRVLYALVGKGINEDMIRRACQFVVGPCSCQVKAQNPGFDLLMSSDWNSVVGDVMISDPLPDNESAPVLLKIPEGRKAR